VLLVIASVVVVVLAVGGLATALKLRANITVLDVNDALAAPTAHPGQDGDAAAEPAGATDEAVVVPATEEVSKEPLNILVMGSDTRDGQGEGFGSAALIGGARSDTTMLVHLSGDREHVTVLSIPRDLMVTLPSCTLADGSQSYPYEDRFNAAFSIGGPECTIRTVTELTGLPVHHFVVVDFTAFERTIDALGGVEVCLTRPVTDPLAGLDLPAGVSRVDGAQGLAFVRARTSLGDGSDLARIERQQSFLASLVREATSRDLLVDPVRLIRSLDAATQSLTMDADLAWLPRSAGLARSLAGVDPADVSFVTYPNVYSDDFLTVRPDEGPALLLTEVLAQDAPWPITPSSTRARVAPSDVAVSVVNATGRTDQATIAAAGLAQQGFVVTELGVADEQRAIEVRHPGWATTQARTVAGAVDGSSLVRDDSLGGIQLVLGNRWAVDDLRTVRVVRPDQEDAVGDTTGNGTIPSGGTDWEVPEGSRPTGETSTADQATCAS
jgi:LCP family protein required for cell wall assembly